MRGYLSLMKGDAKGEIDSQTKQIHDKSAYVGVGWYGTNSQRPI
jgi:hypothetical protein